MHTKGYVVTVEACHLWTLVWGKETLFIFLFLFFFVCLFWKYYLKKEEEDEETWLPANLYLECFNKNIFLNNKIGGKQFMKQLEKKTDKVKFHIDNCNY